MTLADRARTVTVRRAQESALRITDLTIAAAFIDVHGAAHLRPVADRLAAVAAELTETEEKSNG